MDALLVRSGLPVIMLAAALVVASLAPGESPTDLRLPADVTYDSADSSPGPVVFSHATHVALAENRCLACHPEPFAILRPAGRITHEDMDSGRKCGVCHNGTAASGVREDCTSCHRSEEGS
jgi:c(7)-type cytochrome triheme protein